MNLLWLWLIIPVGWITIGTVTYWGLLQTKFWGSCRDEDGGYIFLFAVCYGLPPFGLIYCLLWAGGMTLRAVTPKLRS